MTNYVYAMPNVIIDLGASVMLLPLLVGFVNVHGVQHVLKVENLERMGQTLM